MVNGTGITNIISKSIEFNRTNPLNSIKSIEFENHINLRESRLMPDGKIEP